MENLILTSEKYTPYHEYWSSQFSGFENYSFGGNRGGVSSGETLFENKKRIINSGNYRLVSGLVDGDELGVFVVLASAFALLLSRYSGASRVAFSTPLYSKGKPGVFADEVPLVFTLDSQGSLKDLLVHAKAIISQSYRYQDFPFSKLEERGPAEAGDVSNVFLYSPAVHHACDWQARKDLNVQLSVSQDELSVEASYNSKLFDAEFIDALLRRLEMIITCYCDPGLRQDAVSLITGEERALILESFNDTVRPYPSDSAIAILFEEQVRLRPDRAALIFEGRSLTYKTLNERANQLAHHLSGVYGVRKDDRVALLLDKGEALIISILAILKAGAAYVPLDIQYPSSRIEYILADTSPVLVIADSAYMNKLEDAGFPVFVTDIQLEMLDESTLDPGSCASAGSLAYVLYTSGSTGKPKGVLIEQRSVVRLVKNADFCRLDAGDVLLQTGSIAFDASTFELWGCLLNGAALVLCPQSKLLDPRQLKSLMHQHSVTVCWFTASFFNQLVETDMEIFQTLKTVLAGGDRLSPYHVNKLREHFPGLTVVNGYGPTENTTFTTCHRIGKTYIHSIPIGKPVSNSFVYILDGNNNLLPPGMTGEICAGGDGVARGYLNEPALTAEKFPEDPFHPGRRMYRTGDKGRWLTDGTIEFIGRDDGQVKIRGFRIETAEIEGVLLSFPAVKEVLVRPVEPEPSRKVLACYFSSPEKQDIPELKAFLEKRLPQYMVPEYFIQLPSLPLTVNGKINIQALPDPLLNGSTDNDTYAQPLTDIEIQLASIWEDVLGKKPIGLDDNFFSLGGHSLKATTLLSRVQKHLSVEVPINELFMNPTLASMVRYIESSCSVRQEAIPAAPDAAHYPLSSAQKRIYILSRMEKESTVYNVPFCFMLEGAMDIRRFQAAFQGLIDKHESLRTAFVEIEGEPFQKVLPALDFHVELEERLAAEPELLLQEFVRPFALAVPPLLRVKLVKIAEETHVFLYDIHHIISDGVSTGLIVKDFVALYNGESPEKLKLQYRDFAVWQNEQLSRGLLYSQELYWKGQFRDEIPVLNLPYDFSRPAVQVFEGSRLGRQLSPELSRLVSGRCQELGVTPYMLLLAVYNIVLSKYSGQEDIVVGSPVAARSHADLEKIIGVFVNTLPMRNRPLASLEFPAFLLEVKANALKAYENQDFPFEMLVERLDIARDLSRNPLFDVMFVYQNADMGDLDLKGLKIRQQSYDTKTSKFDILFGAYENADGLYLSFEYNTALFRETTMTRLLSHFENILSHVSHVPSVKLSQIEMLSPEEKHKMISGLNSWKKQYPVDKPVHRLFEEQASRTPANKAILCEEESISYADLDARASEVASFLEHQDIKAGDVVSVCMDRTTELVAVLLGIMKSGAAYLSIDPAYPESRIQYMLEDSKTRVLVVDDSTKSVSFDGMRIEASRMTLPRMNYRIPYECDPSDTAYLIYTSGSTGNPKAVMISHANVASFIRWCNEEFANTRFEVVYAATSCSFDLSVFELFYTLQTGKTIRLLKSALHTGKHLPHDKAVLLNTVPSVISELIRSGADLSGVSAINMAGEPIPDAIKRYLDYSNTEIRNLYGPSECTTYSTSYRFTGYVEEQNIGFPLGNTLAYVLDAGLQPQPLNIPGELYLGGDGVAKGYLFREDLTRERFIKSPFAAGMLYRTGDKCRWREDGTLEYLGRADHQVKIRGFRIETGEIEAALTSHPLTKEVLVSGLMDKDGQQFLCAYYTASGDLPAIDLKDFLSGRLPAYMVPAYFVQLTSFPLTPNGKTDRKALPDPLRLSAARELTLPSTEAEVKMSALWKELLGRETIDVHDNFFELGGHSLKVTVLVSRIHKQLGVEIAMKDVFRFPQLRQLVSFIESRSVSEHQGIPLVEQASLYRLSPAQRRLFILNEFGERTSLTYNMPAILDMEGPVDIERFEKAINLVIRKHETLRTSFRIINGEPFQQVAAEAFVKVSGRKTDEAGIQQCIRDFVKPFDLEKAPLLRMEVASVDEGRHVLLFDMHHIVSDGVSMKLLIDDFVKAYEGGDPGELKIQYKDFAGWQLRRLSENKSDELFWLSQLKGELPVIDMPLDHIRPQVKSFEGAEFDFMLDPVLTGKIRELSSSQGVTPYIFLLSVFNILLSRYSRQEDIIIGTPVSGRTHSDVEGLIGMFVNTVVLRNQPQGDKSFLAFLHEVKQNTLRCFEHQSYPFEDLVEKLDINRSMSRNPVFDYMFSYQNKEEYTMELRDLKLSSRKAFTGAAKFDLTLNVISEAESFAFTAEYSTSLFREETIAKLSAHFVNLLREITEMPSAKLCEYRMLETREQELLLSMAGQEHSYAKNETIIDLLRRTSAEFPGNTALYCNGAGMSYQDLDRRSDALASLLAEKGIGKGSIAGILLPRTSNMILSIIAVLKTGAAYIPIDPEYPLERLRYIARDSNASLLITDKDVPADIFTGSVLNLLDADTESPVSTVPAGPSQADLAYVIYTSGSTGNPKGVMIGHSSLYDYINTFIGKFSVNAQDVVLHQTSISFDTSIEVIFPVLCSGGRLVIVENNKDLSMLPLLVRQNGVTILSSTPVVMEYLNQHPGFTGSLRLLLSGGDVLRPSYIDKLYRRMSVYNGYGPSESTVCTSFHKVEELREPLPIGIPIPNREVYILDSYLNLVPAGVIGEICIGGTGLARGYLNNPELSARKFIENPYRPGERIYRSGDLGKWLADGTLHFCGRIDEQVKIRGYRIEPAEVERAVELHQSVKQSVVLVREFRKDDKSLVAYVVADKNLTSAEIRAFLEDHLPKYMIPSYFVFMDKLPLSPNGKIDRKMLPDPNTEATESAYIEPASETEIKLLEIWKEVLGNKKISVQDNFFHLGGNSLKIIKLLKLVDNVYPELLKVNDLFDLATIRQQGELIQQRTGIGAEAVNEVKPRKVKF